MIESKSLLQRFDKYNSYAMCWRKSQRSPNKVVLYTFLILSLIGVSESHGLVVGLGKNKNSSQLWENYLHEPYSKHYMHINSVNPHNNQLNAIASFIFKWEDWVIKADMSKSKQLLENRAETEALISKAILLTVLYN